MCSLDCVVLLKKLIMRQYLKKLKFFVSYILSLPFRLRYRKTFVFGKNCIIRNCKVHYPKGGQVIIGNNVLLEGCYFFFESDDNRVEIGDNVKLYNTELIGRSVGNNLIIIGKNTTTGACQFEASEGTKLIVGEDCMFSHNIKVWAAAHHSILNSDGIRINPAKSINIGNHCWIGHSVFVLKGSVVPNGSIIGANSIYTSNYSDSNCIYVGTPAKKIKENILWTRDLL